MPLRTPPLRDDHADAGARFTEFGGWDMPVEFGSIREEHASVRESVGKFDVSHMGQLEVSGPDAEALTQRLTTNDVSALDPGDAQYSMLTDEEGTILDDVLVTRLPGSDGDADGADAGVRTLAGDDPDYLVVPNAGHDEEVHQWWTDHRDEWGLEATVQNATEDFAMFAVQGPDAPDLVDGGVDGATVADLDRFSGRYADVSGVSCWASRTGYTGEDGFELVCPWSAAGEVWSAFDCQPCGLGARDTLRIEMGYLLSGQDFDPETDPRNPYEAGVAFTVALDTEFVGRDALAAVDESGVEETFVGMRLHERGVPREGHDVTDEESHIIGRVTSGTMSPTLGEPIALGYLPVEYAAPGTRVNVVIRGESKPATTEDPPFLEGY